MTPDHEEEKNDLLTELHGYWDRYGCPEMMTANKVPIIVWLTCFASFIASVVLAWHLLPERVATHFDMNGHADGWMARTEHIAFVALFGTGLSVLVIGLCYSVRHLPISLLNVPNRHYWASMRHHPRACDFLFRSACWFGSICVIWLTYLNVLLLKANYVQPQTLDQNAFWMASIIFAGITVLWFLRLMLFFMIKPLSSRR